MFKYIDTYLRQVLVIIIVLIILALAWNMLFPHWKAAPWWPLYLSFFVIVTLSAHYILLHSLRNKPKRFIGMFMAVTLGKLVLYLTVLVLNVIYTPFNKVSVIAPFLFFYIVFTFFEMKHLSVRAGGKAEQKTDS